MKPILFNTDMVRAILEGRKTVTRRVVKPHFRPGETGWQVITEKHSGKYVRIEYLDEWENETRYMSEPFRTGDILYVRETWNKVKLASESDWHYEYRASCENPTQFSNGFMAEWRPSIHMPKEAARLFLRVTDVRAERLLTPFFANGAAVLALRKEGMALPRECVECIGNYGTPACIDAGDDSECGILDEIRGDFSDLWDSTIKPADRAQYGWNANPWVWVIAFERISREEALGG